MHKMPRLTREQAIAVLCRMRQYIRHDDELVAVAMAIQLMERASDHDFPEED